MFNRAVSRLSRKRPPSDIHDSDGSSSSSHQNPKSTAKWAASLENLLEDPEGVKRFREFLKKEFSEENVLFWLACEDFKKTQDKKQLCVSPADAGKGQRDLLDLPVQQGLVASQRGGAVPAQREDPGGAAPPHVPEAPGPDLQPHEIRQLQPLPQVRPVPEASAGRGGGGGAARQPDGGQARVQNVQHLSPRPRPHLHAGRPPARQLPVDQGPTRDRARGGVALLSAGTETYKARRRDLCISLTAWPVRVA